MAEARKSRPGLLALYELEFKLISDSKQDGRLENFYRGVIADFSGKPLILLRFAERELSRPVGVQEPRYALMLAQAAWGAPKFKEDREKGLVALEYSRILQNCGRTDLALEMAKRAFVLLKGAPEHDTAKDCVNYYNRVLLLAPGIKL